MKKILLLFAVLLGFFSVYAQNNPFAELGYEPKIATLSQGKYIETFDNDTIVQIGSVLFNTKTQQIVAFIKTDTIYSEATLEPDIVSRWISPDPLADHPNQIGQSPYQYAWNNPVYWKDPDGRCPFCPWLDAVVDVGFVIYDVGEIVYDYTTKGEVDPVSVAALTADAASILVPMSVGAGLVVRASAKINKITSGALKTFKIGSKVENIGNFASKTLLNKHFIKHADEFAGKFRNADEYLKGAQNFFKRKSDEIVQYTRKNGDVVRYDTKNNTFGVASKDGTIKTFFKPDDGFDYLKNQIKEDLGEDTLKEFDKILNE